MASLRTLYPVVVAQLTAASSGQNTVVTAVAGKAINVIGFVISTPSAVVVKFRTGSSTELTGSGLNLGAEGGIAVPPGDTVLFKTTIAENLTVNLSGSVSGGIGGCVWYILTDS